MTHLIVKIQSLADAAAGMSIIPGVQPSQVEETSELITAILEGGTQSGQTVLMFLLKYPDGSHKKVQITANQFEMLVGAYVGAQHRFGQQTILGK